MKTDAMKKTSWKISWMNRGKFQGDDFIEIRSATMLLDIKSLYYTFKNSVYAPHNSEKMHLFEYCDFYVLF